MASDLLFTLVLVEPQSGHIVFLVWNNKSRWPMGFFGHITTVRPLRDIACGQPDQVPANIAVAPIPVQRDLLVDV